MSKMKNLIFILILFFPFSLFAQNIPKVCSGHIKRIRNFESKYTGSRNIDIWFPEGYTTKKKYAVLYMQDGQMLFDTAITWNKTSWDVDDVLTKLKKENKIRDVIVIGIWNGDKTRHADYLPQKPFETLTISQKEIIYQSVRGNGKSVFNDHKVNSNNYLKFLVHELKPFIDRSYSTYSDRKNTFVAGSSMGGLISLYAICEYPTIFGGAACMSTHWPGIFSMPGNPIPDALIQYLKNHLPNPKTNRIYFDHGDQALDSLYPPIQKRVDKIMELKGFTKKNWITKYFHGESHNEKAWNKRLELPLTFLMKQK
jgi:enterochelin esterase-like enzyme